jgi:hypothetical protein
MDLFTDNVADSRGRPYIGATVLVKLSGVTASLYSDNGITPRANPLVTDADGEFWFYAANGDYTLTTTVVSGHRTTTKVTSATLYDPADAIDLADVHTVAGISDPVTTVADAASDVTAVAGISGSVATVAANITSVNSAATNIAAIIAAPAAATSASNSATNAQNSYLAAAALAAGNKENEQQFTGAGPYTLTGTVIGATKVFVNGIKYRLSDFTITNSGKTFTPVASIASSARVDILYL